MHFVASVGVRFLHFGRRQLPAVPPHDPHIPGIPSGHVDLAGPTQPGRDQTRAQDRTSLGPGGRKHRGGRTDEIGDTHGASGAVGKTESRATGVVA